MTSRKRRLDPPVMSAIMRCYEAIGRRVPMTSRDLKHSHCSRWRNATMSPFFLNPQGDIQSQLGRAGSYFHRHKPQDACDAPGAYVNLLGIDPRRADRRILAVAQASGWKVDPRRCTLNAWSARLPLILPKSVHLVVGRYFDRTVYRGFRTTMAANFGVKPRFMRELDAMMSGIEERVWTVLLRHESGKILGGGLVAARAEGAFLFCGSVSEAYRGKGLWNALVAARQMVSAQQGAEFWVTSTRVPQLLGKGEFSFPMTVLLKG